MHTCVSSSIDEPAVINTQTGSVGDHKNFFAEFKTHKERKSAKTMGVTAKHTVR